MVGFRKRTYGGSASSGTKRRRTSGKSTRRFRRTRRSKNTSYSSKSTGTSSFGYKRSRLNVRKYRKALWDGTQFKAHYRSIGGVANVTGTPASPVLARSTVYNAIDNGVNSTFWLATGGAIDIDGGTVPTFEDDIILRGGVLAVDISNTDALSTDVITMKVILGIAPDLPSTGGFNSATRPIGWDATMFPEFRSFIMKRVWKEWNLVIKPGDRVTLKHKLSITKIDQAKWNASGGRPYWIVVANSSSAATIADYTFTTYYSLSFSGDTS